MHVEECWLSDARALRWRRVDDDTLSGFERAQGGGGVSERMETRQNDAVRLDLCLDVFRLSG